jgi:hypothetical protein
VRRLGVIVALGALLGLFGGVVTAAPALARGPKWQPVPDGSVTLTGFCAFGVHLAVPVDKAYFKELKASDGTTILLATGSVRISVTNLETGKTIVENVPGSAKVTEYSDGSALVTSRGRVGFFLPADAERFGLPPLSVTTGLLTQTYSPDGTLTSLSLRGHVQVDICAALS